MITEPVAVGRSGGGIVPADTKRMLSYQHGYHAGNHADVLKHAALTLLLRALQAKDTPLRVFDAHAGAGRYDLAGAQARKTAEADTGIVRLLAAPDPPAALAPYLEIVASLNAGDRLRHYPGSPLLAARLLRRQDRMTLMEMHPQAVPELQKTLHGERRVQVLADDCYRVLPGLLPPPERRGLVLIDPSYELRDEYRKVLQLLRAAHRRWPGGVYMIWYPLIRRRDALRFPAAVAGAGIPRIWQCELDVRTPAAAGMHGSGLLVVNLPWGLDKVLASLLPWLSRTLSDPGAGRWSAAWLVPEAPVGGTAR